MKFTDGQWLLQPGVIAHYAAEAHSVASEGGKLVVQAPTRPIKDRGDTLQGPLLTVTLSAPLPDIVRVRIEHFAGGLARGPQIPLVPSADISVEISDGAESATLTAGELTALVKKDNWGITFEAGGRVLTRSGWRGIGYMRTADRGNHIVEQLSLGVGECVYGLGEHFTAFVKNGQVGPALPPAWSFGLWLSTSFTTNYDENTVTSFIEGMQQRDLPLHVFHFDCFWMREFAWTNFEWDARVFPDPEGMLQRLHARGLKICVWINSYIAQRSGLFAEGAAKGYFIKRTDGSVWQTDLWQPGMAIVDFTNPAARQWFAGHITRLLDMGVDAIKTDFGERIPTEAIVYHDGSDPVKMHNFYPIVYNETVFRAIEAKRGRDEAVLFARSSYASGQRFPVHWGGDCWSTFESMAESLRGGLSLSLCGFGFWSHDIGGFEGTAPAYVYKRWAAFGLLSSHSRLHGSSSYRVPWVYDEEACDVLRLFTKLKCRLMPYLWGAAVEANREGVPTMRAMLLEFPNDPACDTLDRQYMLGDSLLVAPVFTEDGTVDYYLPAGRWTNLLTGQAQEGPRWHRERHNSLSLPLMVRPGTILPLGAVDDRPDYDYAEGVTFRIYELTDGGELTSTVSTPQRAEALRLKVRRRGQRVTASASGNVSVRWRLQFAGAKTLTVRNDARATPDSLGIILQPASGSHHLEFELTEVA